MQISVLYVSILIVNHMNRNANYLFKGYLSWKYFYFISTFYLLKIVIATFILVSKIVLKFKHPKKIICYCHKYKILKDVFWSKTFFFFSACISKYSGGCIQYFPSFHCVKNPSLTEKFETDLRRYLTRKIGFESVMRIRCTKGELSVVR